VLTRGPAGEVLLSDEDLGALVLRPVENEVGIGLACVGPFLNAAPVEEEKVAIAGALDALEKLLRDYLVRIDIGQRQRDGFGADDVDRLH
jgi:hypothetical protein